MVEINDAVLRNSRILLVDDIEANLRLLTTILSRAGCTNVASTQDSRDVPLLLEKFKPDLLLLDLHMPHKDGVELLEEIRDQMASAEYLPILVLTGDLSAEARERTLAAGARDFVTKPFDRTEVLLRIRNLLETRHLHLQLTNQNARLEQRVMERTAELRRAQESILDVLGRAAEYRDDDTSQHTDRVGKISARLAERLGLSATETARLEPAARLHDIGKIGVPDHVLLKAGKLTPAEMDIMKQHTVIGQGILQGQSATMRLAASVALTHHERWDGGGYPHGLAGESIPLEARIVAIADVFDALTHDRPYRPAWDRAAALEELRRDNGAFRPACVVHIF
jgi:putative two-component system response regulator